MKGNRQILKWKITGSILALYIMQVGVHIQQRSSQNFVEEVVVIKITAYVLVLLRHSVHYKKRNSLIKMGGRRVVQGKRGVVPRPLFVILARSLMKAFFQLQYLKSLGVVRERERERERELLPTS